MRGRAFRSFPASTSRFFHHWAFYHMIDGMLLVNKPAGVTSHDVVQIVRRRLHLKRVGHTGTLDPMAQGLLILLVGSATKHQQTFQGHEKRYEGVVRLGVQTDTGDATGNIIRTSAVPSLDRARLLAVLRSFEGEFSHTPPAYSAVKVQGRPAYWWARRQQPVTLHARVAQLAEVILVDWSAEEIRFRVRCSAGTYVRRLAESIAERLGTVGHLVGLVRLTIGRWTLEEAKALSWIREAPDDALRSAVVPVTPP